jgi:hypothetical protein
MPPAERSPVPRRGTADPTTGDVTVSVGPPSPPTPPPGPPICSARDCRLPAAWALQWNNPKLHSPDRRKTWTACDLHRESLGGFLGRRGFLREVEPLDRSAGPEPAGPEPAGPDAAGPHPQAPGGPPESGAESGGPRSRD